MANQVKIQSIETRLNPEETNPALAEFDIFNRIEVQLDEEMVCSFCGKKHHISKLSFETSFEDRLDNTTFYDQDGKPALYLGMFGQLYCDQDTNPDCKEYSTCHECSETISNLDDRYEQDGKFYCPSCFQYLQNN